LIYLLEKLSMKFCRVLSWPLVTLLLVVSSVGCDKSQKSVVRVEGSDTMVNVAQAWAERYHQKFPAIEIHVSGGGSGVGFASLINGVADLANSSR
jgi:phosphate transport system substrate-binding protein